MPTQTDLDILNQHSQTYHIRLDLLNTSYVKIGELSGVATSLTYGLNADSDIRVNASLTLQVDTSDMNMAPSAWMNRLIRLYYGLEDSSGTVVWYLWGSMLLSDNSYAYDETTQTLSLTLVDMMAALTEVRGRQIGGYGMLIPEGINARSAIIATLGLFSPFTLYDVPELPDTVPYDLQFGATSYPYAIIKGVLDLFPTYEMYYSPTGVFTVREIPTGIDDDVLVDETVLDSLIIREQNTSRYSDVKNTTELMGLALDADYTAMECTTTGHRYDLFIMDTFETLEDGARYGFTPDTTSVYGQTLKIQDTEEILIYRQTGAGAESQIAAGAMVAGIPYCLKYTANKFYLLGELDIHVIVQEVTTMPTTAEQAAFKEANDCRNVKWVVNPDSPFAADLIGDVRQVLMDGEYSEIPTVDLAFERAAYENWQKTRLQDTVSLDCVLIPWMSVNVKIQYTSPVTGEIAQYMVKSINMDIENFQMSMSLIKFYPVYPFSDKIYLKNGDLLSTYNAPANSIEFRISDGELVYIKGAGYEESPYANFEFFLGDDGDLYWVH
jgi:hypothetical protein